jgi:hypothetical protein
MHLFASLRLSMLTIPLPSKTGDLRPQILSEANVEGFWESFQIILLKDCILLSLAGQRPQPENHFRYLRSNV